VLKLKRDEPLSSFAFKFNVRRYSVVCFIAFAFVGVGKFASRFVVGRCRFTVSKPTLKAPMVSALEASI